METITLSNTLDRDEALVMFANMLLGNWFNVEKAKDEDGRYYELADFLWKQDVLQANIDSFELNQKLVEEMKMAQSRQQAKGLDS